jgi:hypothetical protein
VINCINELDCSGGSFGLAVDLQNPRGIPLSRIGFAFGVLLYAVFHPGFDEVAL